MQTAQAIAENHQKLAITNASFQIGGISGFVTRMFGCRHKDMSRPLSLQGQTYRSCLDCGARRQFNLKNWEMEGDYYYGLPPNKEFRPLRGLATRRVTVLSPVRG
jgi:hypothetical protein